MSAVPPAIPVALQDALEDHLGPFLTEPAAPARITRSPSTLIPLPARTSTSTTPPNTNPFVQLQQSPSYILKIPQNPYSRLAILRERKILPNLQKYITTHPGTRHALRIPFPAAVPTLPHEALMTHAIEGMDGGRAWRVSQSTEERLSLCAAYGRAARWVHSFRLPAPDLPGPLRTTLPSQVAEDVHSPGAREERPEAAKDWLRLYLRAESARLAPRFTALVPELLERRDRRNTEKEQERAVEHITTMERALADPSLWRGGRNELCFIHGDWTLPNVLVKREGGAWMEVGVVDWGDCGVADRRYDLRMGVWSVLYNAALAGEDDASLQETYVTAFLEAYVEEGVGLKWVLEDWEAWLGLKQLGRGRVREGYWEAWAAAYEVWGLLLENRETTRPSERPL